MTTRHAPSPASASAALGSRAARMVDGRGCAWLRYRGARCHSLGPVVTGVGSCPSLRPAGWNGNDGRAA
jgi:hypothetical protein